MARRFKSGDLVRFHQPHNVSPKSTTGSTWNVAVVIERVVNSFASRKASVEYHILHEGLLMTAWDGYLKLMQTTKAGVKSDSRG